MKDYKEKNNFILRTTFRKDLFPMHLKSHHKNWTLQCQKLYQKFILHIVAVNGPAFSHIITHS